jgi:hypothetical protein
MQFVDGGSRADAAVRLGGMYTDAAGVVYEDEAEAEECLPLLLAADGGADEADAPNPLPSARSDASGRSLTVAPAPPSPRSPSTPPVPSSLAQQPLTPPTTTSRALFSIPARAQLGTGTGADHDDAPVYLQVPFPLPSSPHPTSSSAARSVMMQFSAPVVVAARKQRRWRAAPPPALQAFGFEDEFAPVAVVRTPAPAVVSAAGMEL